MSALHWICALTLALVCCLSAQPVKRDADRKAWDKKEMMETLKLFKDVTKNNCPNDTEIYSPADIPQECLSTALNCAITERMVVKDECGIEGRNDLNAFTKFYSGLLRAQTETPKSPSACDACEAYPLKKVEEFLEDIKSLVERW